MKQRVCKMFPQAILILVLLASILLVACSPEKPATETPTTETPTTPPAQVPNEPIELSLTHLFPPVSFLDTDVVVPWIEKIEEESNGMVKIIDYPAGGLAKPGTVYDAVIAGTVDIGIDPGAYNVGRFPMSSVCLLPLTGGKSSWVYSHAMTDLATNFQAVQDEYQDVHLLWLFCQGPGQIQSRKPIRTIEDMKGQTIRASGDISKIVSALGGSPVDLPASDCYIALQKGTIDGSTFPMESVKTWKINEVVDNYTIVNLYTAWLWVAMNKQCWDSLPSDVQQVFNKYSGAYGADICGRAWNKTDDAGFELAESEGENIIYLSPEEQERWEGQCRPIIENWIETMEADDYPATEIYDGFLSLVDKYNKQQ
jgi:TRAP-type C4-dicarboxylate transport system substrate-binding protein